MALTYEQFLEALAVRESGGSYTEQNPFGYLGKYQMGEAALIDAGYYVKDGTRGNDWAGTWTGKDGILSKADFLSNPSGQENAIRGYMDKQWGYINHFDLDEYVGTEINGTTITASSLLAGAHLMGIGGLRTYLTSGGTNDRAIALERHRG